ncbi:serine hydrolase [Arthrobacter sp. B3I4]|uniref:serine hydrolase domain-containing protein n=1 Tax=Arthrobacter sp. B3I4 TaxID=3042267 RepID=UPI002788398F|nr:serine hydrolase domain-containing protein [Arthrobacter sp. B3I4]MDQ0755043.1 CubicO group peptidase (beta-lactamase class C family) [Arthrobacter sp. B3I4]
MTDMMHVARRMVSPTPGTPPGTQPPAGVTLGVQCARFSTTASAGYRTARWIDGERVGVDPMTVETQHDMASVTKVLATTACLMRLVSDGLVGLEDPVRLYLSGFSDGAREAVTVRDLLLHRGGLKEWYPLYLATTEPEEAHRLVETLPLGFTPGSARHYSDLGFILLGRIVASATGLDLASAAEELIHRPLQLTSTRYARPAGPNVATGARDDRIEATMIDSQVPYEVPFHSTDFAGWRVRPVHGEVADGNAYHAFGGVSGHAGLFSTVPDLLRFGAALAAFEDHEELWHPSVVAEFFAPGPDAGQSLGFRRYQMRVADKTYTVLGHPGYVGCAVGFVPGREIALALGSNRLLVNETPVPTDVLWAELLQAAGEEIERRCR